MKPKEAPETTTTLSTTDLSIDHTASRSELDKEDQSEDFSSNPSPSRTRPHTASPPTTTRTVSQSGDTVLKKQAESPNIGSRPGTTKARPIPDMQGEPDPIPKDPDKDSPNVYVSIESFDNTLIR